MYRRFRTENSLQSYNGVLTLNQEKIKKYLWRGKRIEKLYFKNRRRLYQKTKLVTL
jgi:hypothetical protein